MGAEWDVVIIGGGPAGATLAALMAKDGYRSIVLEKDVFPRDHVGESMVPSNNFMFHRLGFLPKMEAAGFVHKGGVGWTAPRSPIWKFVAIKTSDFPAPNAVQTYSYNVERDEFDALLLRHAHELGAKVVQGANVKRILFDGDRAVGVRVELGDGWEQDVHAKVVVDASGRRCLLAKQLGLRTKDSDFNQFTIWTWFRGVESAPEGYEGFVFFHFLDMPRAWGWQIPLRGDACSIGIVTSKEDFGASRASGEDFFWQIVGRNRTFTQAMQGAERIKPWVIEADYSYEMEAISGPGWLLLGDAFRFVDPIFSSGVDVALNAAAFAQEAIVASWNGSDESEVFAEYGRRLNAGVDVWYETTRLFYELEQLFGRFASDRRYSEDVARSLQGNPYDPVNQERSRRLLAAMQRDHEMIKGNPRNLLRPGALTPPP